MSTNFVFLSGEAQPLKMSSDDGRRHAVTIRSTLTQLAHDIAYSAAVSDIECFCNGHEVPGERRWYDLAGIADNDPEIVADVCKAADYLEQRGALEHHPQYPSRVRIAPEAPPLQRKPLDLGPWPFDKLAIVEESRGSEVPA